MRKVFLLTGFQNWGKTYLIKQLFSRSRFHKGSTYSFGDHDFLVLPQSNDDLGKDGYEDAYEKRIEELGKNGIEPKYIFSAFCPTKEPQNLSAKIINNLYARDNVIVIPIEYKWCEHARLQLPEISSYFSPLPNVSISPLSGKDPSKKLATLQKIVLSNLP
ncbi:hypothetical protein ACLSSQ_11325 [Azospira sp. APE16]|uniref:hypothetical protein n=1 Tax=Azospira TaxID=146937 RepID=UPI00102B0AB3|nr:hypothetical protein [Azospira oryzae]